jgi:hypothetical protein
MANRFTARLRKVLEVRGESLERTHVTEEERSEHEKRLDTLVREAEAEAAQLLAQLDAKDPCWKCRHRAVAGQRYCTVDNAPVPADGCKRDRSIHAS